MIDLKWVEIEHHDGDRSLCRVLGVEEFLRLGPERVATQRSGEGVAFGDALEFSLSAPLCASGDGYGDGGECHQDDGDPGGHPLTE